MLKSINSKHWTYRVTSILWNIITVGYVNSSEYALHIAQLRISNQNYPQICQGGKAMNLESRSCYKLKSVFYNIIKALFSRLELNSILFKILIICQVYNLTGFASLEIFWIVKSIGANCIKSSNRRLTVFDRS